MSVLMPRFHFSVGAKLMPVAWVRPGHRRAVLVALLEEHAGAVRDARLHAGDEVAFGAASAAEAVVGALVLERVVQVHARAVRVQVVGAEAPALAEIAIGDFGIDPELVGDAVRAAETGTAVLLAVAIDGDRVLEEPVGRPGGLRVVADLQYGIGALALLLRQAHDGRVVDAVVARGSRH